MKKAISLFLTTFMLFMIPGCSGTAGTSGSALSQPDSDTVSSVDENRRSPHLLPNRRRVTLIPQMNLSLIQRQIKRLWSIFHAQAIPRLLPRK